MADYYTLLTDAGIAYETACKAAGVPIKLSQLSVGDGGGAVYNPAATATALKREVWRGPLNALFQDEKNPSWLLAEVTIPPEVGGWYVREAGIWTDTGILYAIVKYPESFKPVLATSGSGKEFYIRSIFETSNAELVTLLIDDTVVKATRAWVASYVADELAKLDRKQSVRVATTANIVLSGAQTIDGVAVVAGDRVLVKSQTLAKDNGIYVVANGAWIRAKDADASAEVTSGSTVPVEEGTTLGNTIWQLVTDGMIVVGTTALSFQNVTQGFAPLNSPALVNPTATTPPQFDNSTRVQTTAFAKRMGVEYSSFSSFSASTSLSASHVGGLHSFSNAAMITAVLPSTVGIAQAATIMLACAGAGGLTIQAAAGDVVFTSSGVIGSLTLGLGDTAEFVRLEAQWRLIGGTVALKYGSLMSRPNWTTQPQFDSTKALATTEFVKMAGVEWSNFNAVNSSTVLGSGSAGGVVSAASAAALALTLPSTGVVPNGGTILVLSAGSGAVTILASGADTLTNASGITIPIVLGQGDSALFSKVASEWRLVGGTMALKYSKVFAATFGYDSSQALPSGWLCKTGHGSTNGNAGVVSVTFPVAFPTACMAVVANYGGASSAQNPSLCQIGNPSRTGFTGYLTSVVGNVGAVTEGGFNWVAIGY